MTAEGGSNPDTGIDYNKALRGGIILTGIVATAGGAGGVAGVLHSVDLGVSVSVLVFGFLLFAVGVRADS